MPEPTPHNPSEYEQRQQQLREAATWAAKIISEKPHPSYDHTGTASATSRETDAARRTGTITVHDFATSFMIDYEESDWGNFDNDTVTRFMLEENMDGRWRLLTAGTQPDVSMAVAISPEVSDESYAATIDTTEDLHGQNMREADPEQIAWFMEHMELATFGDDPADTEELEEDASLYTLDLQDMREAAERLSTGESDIEPPHR